MTTWGTAVAHAGGDEDVAREAWRDLEARYGEPHRHYHDLAHATAVARDSAALTEGLPEAERAAVTLAAWAHDVVYDAVPGEDERASAGWLRHWLTRAGAGAQHVRRAEVLVLATAAHEAPEDDEAATALLDADLAILGATPAAYAEYAAAVRREYAKYDDPAWAAGRTAVLANLLARPLLYRSETARARWETAARRNLTAELTRWREHAGDHR
ncbi:HD domain-containing protein [Amycolatopsis sp. CA-161197]|uniref:HD domain-containing protein n=1 Tax=Amycolatopsis sp. CA-161197 TaxID=3239922 RepID=UPI003D8AB999